MSRGDWDLPRVHSEDITVQAEAIDAYGHVNNAVYLQWLDRVAWSHSAALGVPLERCLELDRGMAVVRTVVRYERPALLGDALQCGTWIIASDGKLRVTRRFQIRCAASGDTRIRAQIEYVCLTLSTGRPTRFPPEFHRKYAAAAEVMPLAAQLAPL